MQPFRKQILQKPLRLPLEKMLRVRKHHKLLRRLTFMKERIKVTFKENLDETKCDTCEFRHNCKIPVFLGKSHDIIIGWANCPRKEVKR